MNEVECARCGSSRQSLPRAPLPGAIGELLASQTCAACWREWLDAQVILINERSLTPANPEHFDLLIKEMKVFLSLQEP